MNTIIKKLEFTIHDITKLVKSWEKDIFLVNIMKFYPNATIHICITKAYRRYFFHMIIGLFQQVEPKFYQIKFHQEY